MPVITVNVAFQVEVAGNTDFSPEQTASITRSIRAGMIAVEDEITDSIRHCVHTNLVACYPTVNISDDGVQITREEG
jgi:hypothetical protein